MKIDIAYLNGEDVERLALSDDEILAAVEAGPRGAGAQGNGRRAARPPHPGIVGQGALQRASRLREAARAWRA
jgi:hypothetical protein